MLSSIEKEACIKLIEGCFNFHNRNGRLISTPFEELPDESHTVYYEKVEQPKSLASVLNLLSEDHYDNAKDFYTDLKQVFFNLSYIVTRSGRDWQDAIRMDQHVDETWELRAAEKLLPSLEVLFPDSLHPRLEPTSRRSNANEVSESQPSSRSTKPISTSAATHKRSRSQSASSSLSAEEAQTPIASSTVPNTVTRTQSKRVRKSVATPINNTPDDEGPMTAKDRIPDPESGWMRDGNSHLNSQALANFIITRLKHERLPANNFSSHSIIPHQGALSDTTIAQDSPALKLDLIEAQSQNNYYSSMEAFDQDLYQAFIDAEKAYSDNPERLAGIYVLKRLYQELTQGDGTQTLRDSIPVGAARKLASVTMGPGNRHHLPRNDEPVKLKARDKILLEGLNHKGDHIKIGDWVHIFNPDDPSRPIVAQIFNTYRRVDTGRRTVSVCWYYRPEETVHYMSRTFLENEVFKTGNFIDHVVEDIMGRCLVLFYTKYVRGRPSAPLWTPETPTYICEHRYKDDQYSFKKIKNWDSCVPSNIRTEGHDENFQAYPNIQQVANLLRLPSPFLSPPSDRSKGSGEPIIATPQEVAKELPKDQTKCHDLNLSLSDIERVIGRLPTHPPRRPHGTEPGEESNQPTRSPSILSKSLSLPHPASSSVTPTVSPNLPVPSTSTSTNMANSKSFDLTSLELCHLLGHSKKGPLKRPPCLLDLVASQDCFEKLPEKLFDLGESMTEVTGELNEKQNEESKHNNGQSKAGGEVEDLVWFPCLPSSSFLTSKNQHHLHHHLNNRQTHGNNKKNDQHRDPSLLSANKSVHSQAYLDWISKK
ncbi:hypothetical protein Pst134EB_031084 [Puccinia striiformis f. sp. tritici]|uniref:BAH domain-containing protein n=1 Tax=Puccinia striiformis f. sp. tritici PST-78 TaxID=1165861 RepID=A0A0L0UVI2_9BASI|nr:hypothetical protein Pst134EB_031084 [Puccinia striiformis f. sp. tritici]KNE91020.1 hypothetical protein PSTG_15554 [Puccinia striiformis f. sp. tritici PST-78]